MMHEGSSHRVRFGPYEADFRTQEIWKGGTRIKLSRQPFEILEMLVSHTGELVAREDLERRLWPEEHFVDASHGLNAAINKLREALSDSADQPRYIETLPRRGYRFIGEVVGVLPDAQTSEPARAGDPSTTLAQPVVTEATAAAWPNSGMDRPTPRHWPIMVTATVALVVGSFIGVILTDGVRKHYSPSLASAKTWAERQAIGERNQAEISIEPAGRGFGVSGAKKVTKSIADSLPGRDRYGTLRMAEFRTIIPGDAGNAAPQFSPDGRRIAFMSNRSGPWQIWMSNADGTDPVQVSFTESAGTPRWSPDGQSIVFDAPLDGGTYVFVAPINRSGSARAVAEGRVPSFSRDGKFVYFASDRTGDWQVWKVPVKGGPETQVTTGGGFAALESPDGNVYYSKSDYSNPEIWKVPVHGGVEVPVSPHLRPRTWSSWTVTQDGILLVADLPDGRTDLSLYDSAKQTTRELASLQTSPHWMGATADGRKVVMNDTAERQITMLENLH